MNIEGMMPLAWDKPGMPGRKSTLFVVSDGSGSTAEAVLEAVTVQFPDVEFVIERRPGVRTREQVLAVAREASIAEGIVIHTIVIREIRRILVRECRQRIIPHFDLLGPLIGHVSQQVGLDPILRPGMSRPIDPDYFRRIDAIQFTVQHDDGQGLETLDEADVVLVGVSRSSKTPLSIYLSMRGWKVANIPIVLGVQPPAALEDIDQRRIVAVTLDLEDLQKIRRNRLNVLGQSGDGDYTDTDKIQDELRHFRRIVRHGYPWPIVNMTGKSVEEAAKEIIAVIAGQLAIEIADGLKDLDDVPLRYFDEQP